MQDKKHSITFLGPEGATFSHLAYDRLAEIFHAPANNGASIINPVGRNELVIPGILEHGGYAALAMETRAEGRVAEPTESFIELLTRFRHEADCPFHIIGSIKMKIHFALMARSGTYSKVVAHPKGLGACRNRIAASGVETEKSSSSGQAAYDVAYNPAYASCAALAPECAARKYGLSVLDPAYEDAEAVTTFFLPGPREHRMVQGENNRMLIVFKKHDHPGALVDALMPFKELRLNLIQIHSMHISNGNYDFAIEVECHRSQLADASEAVTRLQRTVVACIAFGPFAVLPA